MGVGKYSRGVKSLSWNFTTDASGNASTTTDPISGMLQRVTLLEGTVSANDWSFTLKDQDAFTLYTNTSVTGNATVVPSKTGTAGVADYVYAIDSTCTLIVANGGNTQTGTVRLYWT